MKLFLIILICWVSLCMATRFKILIPDGIKFSLSTSEVPNGKFWKVCTRYEYEGLINSKQYWPCTNKTSINVNRSRVIRSWGPWKRDIKIKRLGHGVKPETNDLEQAYWLRLGMWRMSALEGNRENAVSGQQKDSVSKGDACSVRNDDSKRGRKNQSPATQKNLERNGASHWKLCTDRCPRIIDWFLPVRLQLHHVHRYRRTRLFIIFINYTTSKYREASHEILQKPKTKMKMRTPYQYRQTRKSRRWKCWARKHFSWLLFGKSYKSGIKETQYLCSLPERQRLRSVQENQDYKDPLQETHWWCSASSRKCWCLDNSRSQSSQWRMWISKQPPIRSRGTWFSHSMDTIISVQNKNFPGNRKELTKVLGAYVETKSHLQRQFPRIWQCLWRFILESLYVNTSPFRNKWDC